MTDSDGLYYAMLVERIDVVLIVACILLGFVAHVLKKVIQYRVTDPRFTIRQYLFAYPYHFFLNICLTAGMALALQQIGQLNGITAFFSGYMANSLVSIFRARITNAHETVSGTQSKDIPDRALDD